MANSFFSDLNNMHVVLHPAIFAKASFFVLLTSFGSVMLVRRRLDKQNLVSVMKVRDCPMFLKPRTIGLLGLGAMLMLGLGYVAFQDDPVPGDLHIVALGTLEVTINADGVTRIKDIYNVASPTTGTALRSPVDVGDQVIAHETVIAIVRPATPALLDSRTMLQAQASVQEAEAALNVAETDLAQAVEEHALARTHFLRTETLVARDVASLTQLEDAARRLALTHSPDRCPLVAFG